MRSRLVSSIALLLLLLSACVTINVYFPAAAAEQAADKIIGEVWGSDSAKPSDKSGAEKRPVPRSLLNRAGAALSSATDGVLGLLVPDASAADADLNVATPAIRQLTQSMEARHAQLRQYYDSGALGLTANGLIELRDPNLVPLAVRTLLRRQVSEENADRSNLYREIALANGHPEWESDIRTTFAQRWIQRASPGWYYNDGSGWKQK